jgi:acyl-CoA synthetase (AMP-forming)/AMP-acid ligase II
VLSHANLLANIRAIGQAMQASSADVFVSWLPLYHDMGLIGAWLGCLYFAAPLYVMSPLAFLVRPESWLWAIDRYRGTLSGSPNFGFELCLNKINDEYIEGLDLSSLRMVANGAEPVSVHTLRRFIDRFGRYGFKPGAMAPVYGLAENSVGLAFPPPDRPPLIDRVDRGALMTRGKAEPAKPSDASHWRSSPAVSLWRTTKSASSANSAPSLASARRGGLSFAVPRPRSDISATKRRRAS